MPQTTPRPGRLWTEPREPSQAPLPPQAEPPQPPPAATPTRPRRRLLPVAATVAVGLAVGAGAFALGTLSGEDAQAPANATTLPASSGAAPADSRSETIRAIYGKVERSV